MPLRSLKRIDIERTYSNHPNQKPWITGNIRTELKARAASFKERDNNLDTYNKSHYALWRTIKQAKRRTKIDLYKTDSDALSDVTNYYERKPSHDLPSDAS